MRISKYIIGIILILGTFIFIGELAVFHTNNFTGQYTYTTFYVQPSTKPAIMKEDIISAAKRNNIEVFVEHINPKSLIQSEIAIYGTKGSKKAIGQISSLYEGKINSFILGEVQLSFHDLKELPDDLLTNTYFLIGKQTNFVNFKRELVDLYAGSFPRSGGNGQAFFYISILWSVSFGLLSLLTMYDVALQKKEIMVRLILGESLKRIVMRAIILDVAIFSSLFFMLFYFLRYFTEVRFYQKLSIMSFLIFLLLNSLIYCLWFRNDYKKDLATDKQAKIVLKLSYVYKIISIVLVILVMASSFKFISDGISIIKQKSFFYTYKTSSIINMFPLEDSSEVYDNGLWTMYEYLLENDQILSVTGWFDSSEYNGEKYCYMDRGSIDYLTKNIEWLEQKKFENKVYFLLPEKHRHNKKWITKIKETWEMNYSDSYEFEYIFYPNGKNFVTVELRSFETSFLTSDPLIMLNNLDPKTTINLDGPGFFMQTALINITDEELVTKFQDFSLTDWDYRKTNVWDYYEHRFLLAKRSIMASTLVLAMLLLLEIFIIRTILRYEYFVNALEIAIKKVLGHSVFSYNKHIFFSTIFFGSLSIAIAAVLSNILELMPAWYIIIGGLFLISMEFVFIFLYIRKIEASSLQKILKRGNL